MAAPGTVTDPKNPFKSVAGQTYAGGSANAISALQHPESSMKAWEDAKRRYRMGLGTLPTQQQLYSDTAHGQFGFDNGGYADGPTIGTLPSMPKPGGLDSYYAANRGPSQWDMLQQRPSGSNPFSGVGTVFDPAASIKGDFSGTPQKQYRNPTASNVFPTGPEFGDPSQAVQGSFPPLGAPMQTYADEQHRENNRLRTDWAAHYQSPTLATPFPTGPMLDEYGSPIPGRADGGPVFEGQPVIVGERGPELMVPKQDATVIPNEYMPHRHLMEGNIPEYLKRFLR